VKRYYTNGQLKCKISWINGKRHGTEKWYHETKKWYHKNHKLESETLWINGEKRDDLLGNKHKLTRLMLLGGGYE